MTAKPLWHRGLAADERGLNILTIIGSSRCKSRPGGGLRRGDAASRAVSRRAVAMLGRTIVGRRTTGGPQNHQDPIASLSLRRSEIHSKTRWPFDR